VGFQESIVKFLIARLRRDGSEPTAKKVLLPDGSDNPDLPYSEHLFEDQRKFSEEVISWDFNDKVVLDLGCGDGGRTVYYAGSNSTARIFGVDPDKVRLSRAIQFAGMKGVENAAFICGWGQFLPFSNSFFDVIITNDVIEHVNDLESFLSECYRVLKKNGLLINIFAPYYSSNGSHVYDWIPIPFATLFFKEKHLIRVLKDLSKKEKYILYQFPGLKKCPLPERLDDLDAGGLGRVTLHSYGRHIRTAGFTFERFVRLGYGRRSKNLLKRASRILRNLPMLEELLSGETVSICRKIQN